MYVALLSFYKISLAQIKNAAAYREKELKAAENGLKEAKKNAE